MYVALLHCAVMDVTSRCISCCRLEFVNPELFGKTEFRVFFLTSLHGLIASLETPNIDHGAILIGQKFATL